jgi:ubiquinone/menaquinone biosynthesis C-methylase UbiE
VGVLPVTRLTDPIEHYRQLAKSGDLHDLSGHELGLPAIEYVNSRILSRLQPKPDDVLLDIGCGDGSLLHTANVATRIGVVPTPEEQQRLQVLYPHIQFLVGLAQSLPLKSGTASKIVCNGVLLLLGSKVSVFSALNEIARLAQPAAVIWLGEIPEVDEFEKFNVYRGTSVVGMLAHQLRGNGFRVFLSYLRSAVNRSLQLDSTQFFFAPPEEFIPMVESAGLKVVDHFKHRRLNNAGKEMESPYRWNYIVTKSQHSSASLDDAAS